MNNIIVIGVVLIVFIVFYLMFNRLKANTIDRNKKRAHAKIETSAVTDTLEEEEHQPGEIFAAIGMALHEYQDNSHDLEDTVLTISRVARSYSP